MFKSFDIAARAGMRLFSKVDVPIIAGGINVMRPFAVSHRDLLVRFLKGYLEAVHFVVSQKDETIKIFGDYLNNRDPEVLSRFYEEIADRVERGLRPDAKSVRFLLDFLARRFPKAANVGENQFTDLSFLDEIRRSGFLQNLGK